VTSLRATLPGCVADFAARRPDKVALREKKLGIWQEYTWRHYHEHIRASARMLWELGVRSGDHVSILSDNCPEWLYADLAAQSLGARAVGIYQTNPPPDVAYVLNDSGSKVLFCEDQEQVDKAVEIADQTPTVERVIVFDPRGTREIDDPRLMSWQEFIERGRELDDADWYSERIAELDPQAPSMVVYTSGTTGDPKGAMLSSANVLEANPAFIQQAKITDKDTVLSYLPLCHVAEKIFSVFIPLSSGCIVHFGESIETVQQDLREVSPTIFLGVPRIWEKMHSSVSVKMLDSSWIKRTLYDYFARRGAQISQRRLAGESGVVDALVWFVADKVVYRPLQERLGLRNCWLPFSGAAPISKDLLAWYHGIGVRVCEGYGQTEGTGVSHINLPGSVKLGSVGKAAPTIECRIADDGEILVRGPTVFCGYVNKPEATAETIDEAGWLHTGDIGSIDGDGYLQITGRKKEIIITSGGKNLSPEKIENALKTSPYVKEAVAIGDDRKFIAALIQVEYDSVSDWATRQKIPYTSFADLSTKPEVRKLIQDEVHKANELLARVEQVRKFELLSKELHQDDGELTATQKVRRRFVHEKYSALIESMYGGGGSA
jgi:long-chain acyl-CoA synthetase